MRKLVSILAILSLAVSAMAQDGWVMEATSRRDYNGATMANGRLGVVTDDRPFAAREIVLAGVFDKEGWNGVSRVARGPVFLNMELTVDGKKVDTPPKEMELLFYLASSPNRVYTRNQLLDEVWGFDYFGDSRTVDVHVKRLREKLEGVSESWNLKTVWGVGYKFEVL